jgi:hypothetical protein
MPTRLLEKQSVRIDLLEALELLQLAIDLTGVRLCKLMALGGCLTPKAWSR